MSSRKMKEEIESVRDDKTDAENAQNENEPECCRENHEFAIVELRWG